MLKQGEELEVTFTTTVLKASDARDVNSPDFRAKEGIFGVQELDVGGEDFVVVFGRTHTQLK